MRDELLDQLVSSALKSPNPNVVAQIFSFCTTLIRNDAHLLEHASITEPMLRLLRTVAGDRSAGEERQEKALLLVAQICRAIDGLPKLLERFFESGGTPLPPASPSSEPHQESVGTSACFLFTLLLQYFHLDNNCGTLARISLLSLIHLALYSQPQPTSLVDSSLPVELLPTNAPNADNILPLALAEHIHDSAFAEVLACALTASYGLLQFSAQNIKDPALDHFLDLIKFTDSVLSQKEEPDRERRLIASSFQQEIGQAIKTLFWENVVVAKLSERESNAEMCAWLSSVVSVLESDGGLLQVLTGFMKSDKVCPFQ